VIDYAIVVDSNGLGGSMTWGACTTLANNVFLSLAVERGSFFHRPQFGLRKRARMKNTAATAALIRHDYLDALQWLIDIGRAKSVKVAAERDQTVDLHRLKISIEVEQADGRVLTFETFREVI
jgi:phage gp46-like protein